MTTTPSLMHTARSYDCDITNTTSVPVAAGADATRRGMKRLELAAAALRALQALGLDDRVVRPPGALQFGVPGSSGNVEVTVTVAIDATSKDSCVLTIMTAFRATDDQARVRLLDAWAIIGPLAGHLAKRAARTVKEYAESDEAEVDALSSQHAKRRDAAAARSAGHLVGRVTAQ